MTHALATLLPIVLVLLAAESPVEAYVDPGSGSMLLQVLLGGTAAVAVIAKLYWQRFLSVFRRGKGRQEPDGPRPAP